MSFYTGGTIVRGVHFYRDTDLPFFELKLCDTSELSYKKHSHEEYSLGIVDKGESSFWYEGKSIRVSPKTIVLIPPELIHACNPRAESQWKYKMLFIDSNWVQGFMKSKGKILINSPVVNDLSGHRTFNLVTKMADSLTSNALPLEKEASVLAVFEQAVQGIRNVKNIQLKKEQPRLQVIRDYLHSCFLEKITLDQLEQISGVNKFQIIRSFKE